MGDGHFEIEGSPATCVNIALYNFAADCDFVVAGPNIGHNLGRCARGSRFDGLVVGSIALATHA